MCKLSWRPPRLHLFLYIINDLLRLIIIWIQGVEYLYPIQASESYDFLRQTYKPATYVLSNWKTQERIWCWKGKFKLCNIMTKLGTRYKLKFLEIFWVQATYQTEHHPQLVPRKRSWFLTVERVITLKQPKKIATLIKGTCTQ